ncbi:MAG: ZIP family metal transporter [Bacteroidota bacterium]
MSIGQYLVLFFSVILGGGLALLLQKHSKTYLQAVLSFGGAYILGIAVLHLMPLVFTQGGEHIGMYVLLGFFIQLLLEQLSGGVEHGHIHAPPSANTSFAIQLMLGLCVHSFFEGLPLGSYVEFHGLHHDHHQHDGDHLFYGIILHKAPAAFALVLLLRKANYSQAVVYTCLFIFALMSPLGAALGEWGYGGQGFPLEVWMIVMAMVLGSFLHIATTIIFEIDPSNHHRISRSKLLAVIAGLGIALLTSH